MDSSNPFDSPSLSGLGSLTGFDDTLTFTDAFALDDEPLFPADWAQQESSPDESGLSSTSLSWDPQLKSEELPSPAYNSMSTLTPAQQERLRKIAMPQHLQYRSQDSPSSDASTRKSTSVSSPESNGQNRKRKSSDGVDDEDDEESSGQHPPVKKTAHNMIEKRYRTNLNDKIAALRDSVPSLRIMTKSARGEDTTDDREDLQGLTPAHKLNKATVLSKATEYINHLEKRNKRLEDENMFMKGRIDAFEKLFMSGSMGLNSTPHYTQPFPYSPEYDAPGPSPTGEPQGMIPIPEDIRRLHSQSIQQQSFLASQENSQPNRRQNSTSGWQTGGGYFGRLMVGSLAGLMIMEGFSEAEQEGDTPGARGLFALPTQLLRSASQMLHSFFNFNVVGYRTLDYMKIWLILGALLYAFIPSLFARTPKSKAGETQKTLAAAPSLASSIQVRRQAWLTAIQTVWVPRHNLFLEAAALLLKIVKLSMLNLIGSHGYAYLTGVTQQQEEARVKAWEIALDAQLAGGDVEVSKSRLTLTLLASGTLPDTPARLMLKAVHIRVLLWEIGNAGFNGFSMFQVFATRLARWKWNEAKQLQRSLARTRGQHGDELPEHLAALLDQECDEVLVDTIGQRAYNLAWNLPTTHNSEGSSDAMDGVVEDFAIRSPLDAVAAWYSSLVLQRALSKSLEMKGGDAAAQKSIVDDIALAVKTAPLGSGAQTRALIARAVLVKEKRGASIGAALQVLGPSGLRKDKNEAVPTLINTATSIAALPDITISLNCAVAIAYLQRFPSPSNPEAAHGLINSIVPVDLTLLSFTALFKLIEEINGHELVAATCTKALERLAGNLRVWIGSKDGEKSGLDRETKREIVERCLDITKQVVGMKDAGYESMSEEDMGEGC